MGDISPHPPFLKWPISAFKGLYGKSLGLDGGLYSENGERGLYLAEALFSGALLISHFISYKISVKYVPLI